MPAAAYTLVRYLVAFLAGWLAQHGWTVAAADGPTLDAVAQLVIGGAGLAIPATIGVLTGSVKWMVARLKARHPAELVTGAAELPDVKQIVAAAPLAIASPNDKVVPPAVQP